jgi:hypothetical protein
MNKEFIPEELEKGLLSLGYETDASISWQDAFKWLREKYDFTYSIGTTNIGVVHVGTTFLLQDNASFEEAQFECLKKLIEVAINRIS